MRTRQGGRGVVETKRSGGKERVAQVGEKRGKEETKAVKRVELMQSKSHGWVNIGGSIGSKIGRTGVYGAWWQAREGRYKCEKSICTTSG